MIISRTGRKVNIFILKLLYIYYLFFYVVVDKYTEAIEDKYVEDIVDKYNEDIVDEYIEDIVTKI